MHATGSLSNRPFSILDERRLHKSIGQVQQFYSPECNNCPSAKSGYFCNLSSAALAEFRAISTAVRLREDAILFMEGQPSTSVSFICEGRVKLTRSSRHGKTLLVRMANPGEALGLSAALGNLPHEVTAQAVETVHIRMVQREVFLDFIRGHSEGSLRAAENLGREYRAVVDDAYRLALSTSIAGRVAHLLLEFAREGRTLQDAQPEIHMSWKHEELGFKLGSSRESVTRILNDFKRAGILSVAGKRMVLLNKDALVKLL